jgi:hypothetical protein
VLQKKKKEEEENGEGKKKNKRKGLQGQKLKAEKDRIS